MINLFLFTAIIVCAYFFSIIRNNLEIEFLDINYAQANKGLAILLVLFSHVGACYGITSIQFIAGAGVSLFLILSGYGLELSKENRGMKHYWKKRVLKVCLPFWLVIFMMYIYQGSFSWISFFQNITFINPFNWYLRYIVVCYIEFYLVYLLEKYCHFDGKMVAGLWILIIAIMILVERTFPVNESVPLVGVRQVLSFPFGIWLAKNQERFRRMISGRWKAFADVAVLCLIGMGSNIVCHAVATSITVETFLSVWVVFPLAIAVLIIGNCWPYLFNNKMLRFVGKYSYELFLVHLFTQRVLNESIWSLFLFFIITISLTILLHFVCEKISGWLQV